MEAIERDWVEAIATSLVAAWEEEPSAFLTRQDVRTFVLDAMEEMNVSKRSRRWVSGSVHGKSEVRPILAEIRRREADAHRPFTGDSPLEFLPFSRLTCNCLRRSGLVTLGDLLLKMAEGRKAILVIRQLGEGILQEILEEIDWCYPIGLGKQWWPKIAMEMMEAYTDRRELMLTDLLLQWLGKKEKTTTRGVRPSDYLSLRQFLPRLRQVFYFPGMRIEEAVLSKATRTAVALLVEEEPKKLPEKSGFATIPLTRDQIREILGEEGE